MRIAILGCGLIGGSIGLAARERLGAEVVCFDADPVVGATAVTLGIAARSCESVAAAVRGADVVFVCVPVGAVAVVLGEALAVASGECVLTDVGSTKRAIVAAMDDPRFVGGHPLAGAEFAGPRQARSDLFEHATWYLTPTEHVATAGYERLRALVAKLGAKPVAISAAVHDELIASVSHLPHVLANLLVAQVEASLARAGAEMPIAGRSLLDATRVAGSNSAIWVDIYRSNRINLCQQIDELIARLGIVKEYLGRDDADALLRWQSMADEQRAALHQGSVL